MRKPAMRSAMAVNLLLTGLLTAANAFAAEGPVIEAIEGDKIVIVVTPDGNRVGRPGTEISFGDRIKTGPQATAKIRYPDGSKLIIGRATEMEVQNGAGQDAGRPTGYLLDGQVRGLIKKKIQNRPSFVIKSKSATMGVRGTDFFFGIDSVTSSAQVHTLDGAVAVAETESALLSGKGVLVQKGQMVKAGVQGISDVIPFDQNAFLARAETANPAFTSLASDEKELLEQHQGEATGDVSIPEASAPLEAPSIGLPSPPMVAPPAISAPPFIPLPDPADDKENDPNDLVRDEVKPRKPAPKRARFRPGSFQFNQIFLRQPEGGHYYSSQISWNPTLDIAGPFSLRGHFGFYHFRSRSASGPEGSPDAKNSTGFGIESAGLVSVQVWKLIGEAGMGRSGWWHNHSRPGRLLITNVGFKVSELGWLERIFLGVARFDRPADTSRGYHSTFNMKLGIGIQF